MRRRRSVAMGTLVLAMAALVALIAAPLAGAAKPKGKHGGLKVKITRSAHGIPNIKAKNWKSLGFGYGYAFAEDNICTIADSYVTVSAERSKFFGPDAESPEGERNLDSDIFYKRIIERGIVEDLIAQKPPAGPKRKIRQEVKGYVKGYNRYLKKTGVDNIPDPRCAGEEWVRPIDEIDVYRRFYELALYASGGVAIEGIANAQPPAPAGRPSARAAETTPSEAELGELGEALDFTESTGSNAWGLGSEVTASGGGITLANPHFPWQGPRRFYQSHLTIPGKLNVSGGSLFGVPLILIGHTQNMAWSHTVSTAYRFVPYQLELAPGDPTSYVVDGQTVPMERTEVTVDVKQPDGSIQPVTRTLYDTRYGPITTSIQGQNLFGWTSQTAFAFWDANGENMRLLNHFFDTNHAQSTKELLDILQKYEGIPWVNTIASDRDGRALYADIGSIPNVSDEKATSCASALGQLSFPALGLPTLDGSRSECAPEKGPDAAAPGIMGDSQMPYLFRRDYVANSNDSYWLTNPEQPLEGYDRIIGTERTQRSLRTRLGLMMIQDRLAGTDGLPGKKFTRRNVRQLVFQNRHLGGELWREPLVAFCNQNPTMTNSAGQEIDVTEACAALAAWDEKVNLDSRGAVLFARFMDHFGNGADNFTTPFDVADPVGTPNGLNTSDGDAEAALADAVTDLRASSIPLNANWGEYHYEVKNERQIPIHGGEGGQGVFNAISDGGWTPGAGYDDVEAGSSFVMVTEFKKDGCPKDNSILTYSLSENPESPFYADQTEMYSRKKWNNPPFCGKEVRKAAEDVTVLRAKK